MSRSHLFYLIATVVPCSPACSPETDRAASGAPSPPAVKFAEVAAEAGIDFQHTSGRSGRKYGVETIGSGAAFLDYDNDGYVDLYVVNGADLPGHVSQIPPRNALYHNEGSCRFAEVAAQAGVADTNYGMGCTVGDYDNDGDADLFVANFGPNALYRNEGESGGVWRFQDVTARTILGDNPSWSTGCAFADYDLDGDLDLYVANYLEYNAFEGDSLNADGTLKRPRRHLAPTEYPGQRDFLYRNDGGERFVDVTQKAGLLSLEGRELGVVFFDFDRDGDADLFQANDATPNFLYRNEGDGTFAEIGLPAGVAYNSAGKPEGSMGVDAADVEGDGDLDLVITNFQWESNTLYANQGTGLFQDESMRSGIGLTSLDRLAFGVNLFDVDNDGDQDLFVANGHIDEDIERFDPQATYAQQNQLYLNDGRGYFTEITAQAGPGFASKMVGRGSAVADCDNDGDLDLFVLNTGQRALLLRNDTPRVNHWLALRLEGTQSNRDGFGAHIAIRAGDLVQVAEARSATSYLSQDDPRLFFGLGSHDEVDRIEITWPSGIRQELHNLAADQVIRVAEPAEKRLLSPRISALAAEKRAPHSSADLEKFWQEAPMALPPAVRARDPGPVPDLNRLEAAVAAAPDRAAAHCELATVLRLRGDYTAAETHYRRALELDAGWAAAHIGLGQLRSARGDVEAAIRAFEEAIRLDSTRAEPHYHLGNILVRQQRFEQAIAPYEQAIALDPTQLQAYINLAGLHSRQTDYGLAIAVLRRGLEALSGNVELMFQLGRIYFIQARYAEALQRLREVARLEPDHSSAYEIMAQIYLNQKDIQEALRTLHRGLASDSSSAALRTRLGILLLEQGKQAEAVEHLGFAMQEDPDRAEAYYTLGQAYIHLGEEERGRLLLRYFRLLQDNYQELLKDKIAIVLNPNSAESYYDLGAVYSRIGRYEAARQTYALALRIDPAHVNALNNLGNIYLRRRQLADAIEIYQEVLRHDSTHTLAYNNLGYAYLLAGQEVLAVQAFKEAIQLDTTYAQPYANLARIYMKQRRRAEAEELMAIYRRLAQKGAERVR